jgi:Ras-specific guanine nucleotide-releasing factor 1
MMRKRNNIIFNLVESEREYVHQLEILVANYVRPFRMGKNKNQIREFLIDNLDFPSSG